MFGRAELNCNFRSQVQRERLLKIEEQAATTQGRGTLAAGHAMQIELDKEVDRDSRVFATIFFVQAASSTPVEKSEKVTTSYHSSASWRRRGAGWTRGKFTGIDLYFA
jgi:hypothetical protein